MGINIERLLRLTADYQKFCNDDYAVEKWNASDELSEEDLDFVAAAAGGPVKEEKHEKIFEKTVY